MSEDHPLGLCGKFRRHMSNIKKAVSRTFRRISATLPSISDLRRKRRPRRTFVSRGVGTMSITRLSNRMSSRVMPETVEMASQTTENLIISRSRRMLSVSSQPLLNIDASANFGARDSLPGILSQHQRRQIKASRASSILKIRPVPKRVNAEFVPMHMRDTLSSRLKSRRLGAVARLSRARVNPTRISSSSSNNLSTLSGFSRSKSRSSLSRNRSREVSTLVVDVQPIVPDSNSHLVGRTGQTELESYRRDSTVSTSASHPLLPPVQLARPRRVTIVAPVRASRADMYVPQRRPTLRRFTYNSRGMGQRRYFGRSRTAQFRRRN